MQFPVRGNYRLVCLVHENMTGVVHVLEPAAAHPLSQSEYDELAAQEKTKFGGVGKYGQFFVCSERPKGLQEGHLKVAASS